MQDVQNIPPPDVNSPDRENDFGNHSDIEQDLNNENSRSIPVPPDQQPAVPIEEPQDDKNSPVGDDENEPKRIV